MNKILFVFIIISAVIITLYISYSTDLLYYVYAADLLTSSKPCVGIGNYCTFYTENQKCEKGSDYVICEDLPPFFNPNATDWSNSN